MAIKYVPYYPQPVEGQAVLNNFTRTQRFLKYKNNEVESSFAKGMPLYQMESIEKVGENVNKNLIIRGECLSTCAYLKENNIKVDLVYIDPPFDSDANYAKKVFVRKNPLTQNGDKTELERDNSKPFDEEMYGDIWNKEAYLNWIYENLTAIKSVMSDTASIYVHLSWHIGHYVKIILDEIFGENNFINEIVWQYFMGGKGDKEFAKKHDNIFLYAKDKNKYIFNKFDIKRYYDFKPSLEDQSKDASSGKDDIGYYGIVACPDVWSIKGVFNMGDENREYKTQKPEALLERVIKASSDEGMIVADFFGGSGVTSVVANKMNRRFITCDIGINSIQTMRDKLVQDKAEFEILEVKDGVSLFRNPQQTNNLINSLIKGLKKEKGLNKFWRGAITDSKLGMIPVYIPNLIEGKRVLDLSLMNDILQKMFDLTDQNIKKVIVYYIDIENREELEKFMHEQNDTNIEIELRDLKQVLSEVVYDDEIFYHIEGNEIVVDRFVSDRVMQKINEFNEKKEANSKKEFKPLTISEEGLEMIEFISLDCTNSQGSWKSDSEVKIENDKNSFVTINGEKTKSCWNGRITFDKKPLRMKVRNICGDEIVVEI